MGTEEDILARLRQEIRQQPDNVFKMPRLLLERLGDNTKYLKIIYAEYPIAVSIENPGRHLAQTKIPLQPDSSLTWVLNTVRQLYFVTAKSYIDLDALSEYSEAFDFEFIRDLLACIGSNISDQAFPTRMIRGKRSYRVPDELDNLMAKTFQFTLINELPEAFTFELSRFLPNNLEEIRKLLPDLATILLKSILSNHSNIQSILDSYDELLASYPDDPEPATEAYRFSPIFRELLHELKLQIFTLPTDQYDEDLVINITKAVATHETQLLQQLLQAKIAGVEITKDPNTIRIKYPMEEEVVRNLMAAQDFNPLGLKSLVTSWQSTAKTAEGLLSTTEQSPRGYHIDQSMVANALKDGINDLVNFVTKCLYTHGYINEMATEFLGKNDELVQEVIAELRKLMEIVDDVIKHLQQNMNLHIKANPEPDGEDPAQGDENWPPQDPGIKAPGKRNPTSRSLNARRRTKRRD